MPRDYMTKHRGFPGRYAGSDYQFTIRRANPKGVTPLKALERYKDRKPMDNRVDAAFMKALWVHFGDQPFERGNLDAGRISWLFGREVVAADPDNFDPASYEAELRINADRARISFPDAFEEDVSPAYILDGRHTAHAVRALAAAIETNGSTPQFKLKQQGLSVCVASFFHKRSPSNTAGSETFSSRPRFFVASHEVRTGVSRHCGRQNFGFAERGGRASLVAEYKKTIIKKRAVPCGNHSSSHSLASLHCQVASQQTKNVHWQALPQARLRQTRSTAMCSRARRLAVLRPLCATTQTSATNLTPRAPRRVLKNVSSWGIPVGSFRMRQINGEFDV